MISHSKTGCCRRNRDHFVVFNAQIFSNRGCVLRHVDLDLTLDAAKLTEAARISHQNLFVLYDDVRSGDKPMSAVLREAVWWTQLRSSDQDRFFPLSAGRIWMRQGQWRCDTGLWQDQPAYSVDLWTNQEWESLRNYSGAVVQLMGCPPRGFQPAETEKVLDTKVSNARGRSVRPVFYQRTGRLAYVWFSHAAAMPAMLYDLTVRDMGDVSFTVHRENSAIHVRREGSVIGLLWPCGISAPDVTRSALAHLRHIRKEGE